MRPSALALALLLPLPAFGYKRTQNGGHVYLFWGPRGHSFQIDSRGTPDVPGTSAFDAVRKSFTTWGVVTCSDLVFPEVLPLEQGDRRVGYFRGELNRNLVLWRTASCSTAVPPGDPCTTDRTCPNKYDCWDKGTGVIATTTTTSSPYTGQIFDSDIELNDSPNPIDGSKLTFTTADSPPCDPALPPVNCVSIDVQNTVTHEAGHSIGLDHTTDQTATMAAFAPAGETSKRTLHPDDIQGICAIYPRGAQTSTSLGDPISITLGGSGGCGCSSRTGSWEALLAPLGLLALRRRRRI